MKISSWMWLISLLKKTFWYTVFKIIYKIKNYKNILKTYNIKKREIDLKKKIQ